MSTIEERINQQDELAIEIQKAILNYKKTPKERRTMDHFEKRSKELSTLWETFERQDNAIRREPTMKEDHPYYTKNVYSAIGEKYNEVQEDINKNLKLLKATIATKAMTEKENVNQTPFESSLTKEVAINNDTSSRQSSVHHLVRRLLSIIKLIHTILDSMLEDTARHTHSDLTTRLAQIENHMSVRQKLYEQICLEDVEYNLDEHQTMDDLIMKKIAAVKDKRANLMTSQSDSSRYIPNITIPVFDGDYLQWRPFFELFNEIIHTAPISTIKKMHFLKTSVTGEAAKLILHLSPTEGNYKTAWTLLQERYNNTRLLTSTLFEKLLTQGKIASDNPTATAIRSLHDTTRETLSALNNLGLDTSTWDPLIIHILMKKLDKGTHLLYEQSLENPKELPCLNHFLNFLETRFQSLEAVNPKEKAHAMKACTSIVSSSEPKTKCSYCQEQGHLMYLCPKYKVLPVNERLQVLKTQNRCFNCLRMGHSSKNCYSSKHCSKCRRKHHTLVHVDDYEVTTQNTTNIAATCNDIQPPSSLITTQSELKGYVLLSTAVINLVSINGQVVKCRALLDSGSQVNLITEKVAKQLGVPLKPTRLQIEGIGRGKNEARSRVNVTIQSRVGSYTNRLEAFILPNIVSQQPTQQLTTSKWPIPENLLLADPRFNIPGEIDVLIGAELYHNLLTTGQMTLKTGLPTLQNTVFGWIIAGKISDNGNTLVTCSIGIREESSLQENIEKFWQLENVTPTCKIQSTAERNCEDHFKSHTIRSKDGRFIVKLPFADQPSRLGDSKQIAINRFYSLERRLAKDGILKAQYVNFMNEYKSLGHMTKFTCSDINAPCYVIPHHCVTRPESSTTKLRVVFDASSKTSTGLALNDIMYTGPTIQAELFSILLRFRCPKYVFTSDIEKMYRQILINEDDRKYQIIVWRDNTNEDLQYYQLNTVTYGTRSAPYLAIKCLQQLGIEHCHQYPLGAKILMNDFYVDDCLSGSDDLDTAIESQRQLKLILLNGGFRLRKWCANSASLLQYIPPEDQEVNLDFDNEVNQSIKTLGLTWLPKTDVLCIKVNLSNHSYTTKRTIVSDVAKIFDPLGLLSPVVVTAKILIQQLWQMKLSWDEEIPKDVLVKWLKFRNSLDQLNNTQIPRHIIQHGIRKSLQLHAFCDASEKAYGAVIYARSVCPNGTAIVRLLCARSRIAPLKIQTIPRLELCAALLGAQLLKRVQEDLNTKDAPVSLWTDSQVVLAWINSSPSSFHTFVANRISQIQELSSPNQWCHISSKNNPADVLSRGLSPSELVTCRLWQSGPEFLQRPAKEWPKSTLELEKETILEQKGTPVLSTISIKTEDPIRKINHRNSFSTLVNVVAYMLRFINHTRNRNQNRATDNNLTPLERQKALSAIIRNMQTQFLGEEVHLLTSNKSIRPTSKLASMNAFLDNEGIIRVGGRLQFAKISYNAKHPIILPYDDDFTKLLAIKIHQDNLHCGPQTLLAHLRQRFWPIKGKSLARATVLHCVRCCKAKPKLLHQLMGQLPAERVQPARPFINSGVDFCGPFWIHFKGRGRRPYKAYLAVFCCFTTKAIHLEIVGDLTTEAFIGCLKRFIGRRGHCKNLYCDNATNFVGAKNQLQELKQIIHTSKAAATITRMCSNKGIKFNFIPPRAPHFGGLWEAAVKSAKHLFVRSASSCSLTYEELETVMVEIEAILNSRPLSPMSADPNDISALTPGHFLIGEPLTSQIDTTAEESKMSLLTRWKLVSHIKHQFWKQWSRDYLNELQHRNKWRYQQENITPGTLVTIKEDNIPPLQWPLGRVIKTYKGSDNTIRVADIRTSTGVCKRSIHRLAPLPVRDTGECDLTTTPSQNKQHTTKSKRRGSLLPSILLAVLLLFPLAISNPVTVKNFHKMAGIHFEKIGKINTVSSEWTLVVFYDLLPLQSEIQALSNGTIALNHICKQLQQKTGCEDIVTQYQRIYVELATDNHLLAPHRQKRGALNIVGNVANSLFGVLDSEYAEKMSNTITAIQNNEQHLMYLLKNQTSIIDSTINIVKENHVTTSKVIKTFEGKLTEISNRLRSTEKDNHDGKLYQIFITLSLELTIMTFNIQRIQSAIISVMTNIHHGQISPLLLSPQQLNIEITKTIAHLPPNTRIPGYQGNLLSIYKLMTVKAGITPQHAIFKLTLPLSGSDEFDVFQLIPIPTLVNNTMKAIKLSTELLAITLHRDRYFPTSMQALQHCTELEDKNYICPNKQPIYNKGATSNACEISLFNNETRPICEFTNVKGQFWVQTNQENQWIFALPKPIQVTAICKDQVLQISLTGSGFIQLTPECIIKHELITLLSNHVWSSSASTSYTSFGGISKLERPTNVSSYVAETTLEPDVSIEVNKLTALQKGLASLEIQNFPHQTAHHHSLIIAYSALGLVILLLGSILYHKLRKPKELKPQPTPRTMKTEQADNEEFVTTFTHC